MAKKSARVKKAAKAKKTAKSKKVAKAKKTAKGGAGGGVGTAANGFAFANIKKSPDNFTSFSKDETLADSRVHGPPNIRPLRGPRKNPPVMALDEVLGNTVVQQIQTARSITIHTVGDSGGIKEPAGQFAVADALAADLVGKTYANGRAAFFYHLGDVVYYFGQERYYYDQFYDPYRDYEGPIFAIPGNHDGMTSPSLDEKSLDGFWNNFCSDVPRNNPDAQGFARTTMTQPGIYFTLNAPFVKVIGLYSNCSESDAEGVISDNITGPAQLNFLKQQLTEAAKDRDDGKQFALLLAVHHPAYTTSEDHMPSPTMLKQIDAACKAAKIYPDMVLSGHAHLYERYTRFVDANQIPFLVAGCGGFYNLAGIKNPNLVPPTTGKTDTDEEGYKVRLEKYYNRIFGFLRLTISATQITGEFIGVDVPTRKVSSHDKFTVNLRKNGNTVSSP